MLQKDLKSRQTMKQDGLRDVWTYGMTLALAYMLCYLFAMQSQFLIEGKSLDESEY